MARKTSTKRLDRTINRRKRATRDRFAARRPRLRFDNLEAREMPAAFSPGNLIVLQAGDNNQYATQAPLYLNELTPGGSSVQQAAINNTNAVGGTGNQPITIDLTAAAGNGQLNRTYDGAGLVFGGVDSGVNNGGYTPPQSPTGNANRVIAVVGNDPAAATFVNTTTYGPFYVGDDNRGGVAEGLTGPVWAFGHPNQAGGAVSQGVLYFPGPNGDGSLQPPGTAGITSQSGVQVSGQTNIRGGFIGFDNRVYWTTAGSTSLGLAGVYTSTVKALPTDNSPGNDQPIVKALFAASKVGGMYLADVNGDGVLDNGDRIYLNDDGTVGGAGTGGLYMAVFDTTRWGTPVTGQAAGWSPMVRIAEGVIDAQPTPQNTAQLRGLAGTVLANSSVQLYASEFDNVAGNNSYVLGWNDATGGVFRVQSASISGTTATITLSEAVPAAIRGTTTWLSVNSVGSGSGTFPTAGGYNGVWNATVSADGLSFTYTNTNPGLTNLSGSAIGNGTVGQWLNTGAVGGVLDPQPVPAASQIIQTLADGTLAANPAKAQKALRGVAFAPVAATTLSSLAVDGLTSETVPPNTSVTFSVHVANPQAGVTLTGLKVTFVDVTTNTALGQGTINASGDASLAIPVVGQHIVKAYFAGGGAQALAPVTTASTVTVNASGATASSTSLAVTIGGAATTQAAIGRAVTLTATVTSGATGTVSFRNGTTLLGSATISAGSAVLTTSFSVAGPASITATYNGDATFATSSSGAASLTIGNNATAAITTSANNVAVGATPTYTATLTGPLGTVAGTVQFLLDGVNLGSAQTLNGSGSASVTSTALTAGSHVVTIKFTPAATSPYNAFNVDTVTAANGVALIETARQALTPGNLLAVQRGDGTTNLGSSGYLVFLDEYRPDGTLVQRIALPNADSGTTHALLLSGQNGAEGLLQQSGNGQYVTIVGYDVPVGQQFVTSTQPYQFGRTIARIDAAGNVDTSTSITTSQTAITAATWAGGVATITAANTLKVGDPVTVSGVTPAGFNGTFTVSAATASSFTYALATNPGGAGTAFGTATGPSVPFNPEDVVTNDGTGFWIASSTGTGDTVDSGILFAPLGASTAKQVGPINHGAASIAIYGTGASAQLAVVNRGAGELGVPQGLATVGTGLPQTGLGVQAITTLVNDGTGTVTVTLGAAPNFTAGNQVVISGASVAAYNAAWQVTGVSGNTFTFSGAPAGAGSGTGGTATANQLLANFPNLETEYEAVFPTGRQPEQFVFLNTNDGSTNNPNLAYLADQAYGLLKFWKANDGNWHLGQLGSHAFGQKLVFAGGATGVIATIVNPGTPQAKVNIFVTGSNVQQANPNQIAVFQDQNGAPAGTSGTGVDQGFSSGNFNTLAFVGGTPGLGTPASPNGNMNFAGLSFVPGFVSGNLVVDRVGTGTGTLSSSATAGFLDQYDPTQPNQTATKGSVALPTGGDVSTITGATWSNGVTTITGFNDYKVGQQVTVSGVTPSLYNGTFIVSGLTGTTTSTITGATWASGQATFTANNSYVVGQTVTVTGVNPGGYNGAWTVTSATATTFTVAMPNNPGTFVSAPANDAVGSATGFTYTLPLTAVATASRATDAVNITAATWANTNGGTVTITAANTFTVGQTVIISGITPTGYNGTFVIASANATSFTYLLPTNPGTATVTGAKATPASPVTNLADGATSTAITAASTASQTANIASVSKAAVAVNITAASWSAGKVTITAANSFVVGQAVTIAGITPAGFNGTFTIATATSSSFTYNLAADPGTPVTFASTATATGFTATITTAASHSFIVGQSLTIAGITPAGYNGTYTIASVPSATTFTYNLLGGDPGAGTSTGTAAGLFATISASTGVNTALVGQSVIVANVNGSINGNYNGTVKITAATATTLTYAVPTDPGTADLTAGPTVTFNTATVTAANSYAAGNSVAVAGVTGATTFNGAFPVVSASPTSFTYYLPSNPIAGTKFGAANVLGAVTESGSATGEGYLSNSADGHSLVVAGYNQTPGGSTSANNTSVGVVNPAGVIDVTTQMPSQGGSVRAVASADGLGMWVATNTGIRYVPFGNTPAQTAISAASWSPTGGGTVTISAANNFVVGQLVAITGVTPSGYNGAVTILSRTATSFTYALATNPGTATNLSSAFVQPLPTLITNEIASAQGQAPTVVEIGASNPSALGAVPGQLVGTAGAQFQNNGVPSVDGPFYIGSGLGQSAGQAVSILGTGTDPNWPAVRDIFNNFPSTNQIAISPSGNTIVVADSRTDSKGGILVYFQALQNSWVRLANLQQDNFAITAASEPVTTANISAVSFNSATISAANWINGTVTITTSAAHGFAVGQKVIINGFTNAGYNGQFTIASVPSSTTFTYAVAANPGTPSFTSPTATLANVTVTTSAAHNFVAGQNVTIAGVSPAAYVGTFAIASVPDSTHFTYVLTATTNPGSPTLTSATATVNSSATITTSSPVNFTVGQTVSISGVDLPAYNTNSAVITSVAPSGLSFTYNPGFSNLASSGPGVFGAFANGLDGGFRAITADWSNPTHPVLYATTTASSGNRLFRIPMTLDETTGTASLGTPVLLATAPANTAFRGVAFAPTNPGTTASTTSLSVSGSPGTYGAGVNLTATVTTGATGWVSFRTTGGVEIGAAPLSGNTATLFTTANLPPGVYTNGIVAVYTGDNTFAPSTSAAQSATINKADTSVGLALTPPTVGTGQTETLAATVTPTSSGAPTGTVTFTDTTTSTVLGTAPVTQVIVNQGGFPVITFQAVLATTFAVTGSHSISVAYSGDSNFNSSTGTNTLQVVQSTTTTVTSDNANPGNNNQTLNLTAKVTASSGTPAGSVQFYDGSVPIGSPVTLNVSGVATLAVKTAAVQSVTIKSISQSTSAGTTTVTVTTNTTNPFTVSQSVTIEGVATGASPGNPVQGGYTGGYNGTFTVASVSGNQFTLVNNAAAGLPTDTVGGMAIGRGVLTPGMHSLSAIYNPGANAFGSSNGIHQQSVQTIAFGANDQFIERLGDGLTALNTQPPLTFNGSVGATNFIDEFTAAGVLVQSIALPSADSQSFAIASISGDGTTVTVTTSAANDLATGQKVTIAGVSGGTGTFNGDFTITVTSSTTFTYLASGNGTGTATGATAQGVVHAVVGHGQQSTTGQVTLSGDGAYLFVTGYDQNPNPASPGYGALASVSANTTPRSIARIRFDGLIETEAFTAGSTGIATTGNFNAIYSPDGSRFYVGNAGTGSIYYFSSFNTSATPQGSNSLISAGGNLLSTPGYSVIGLESYGGNLFVIGGGSGAGTNFRVAQVGTGFPTTNTGLSVTQLPGIPTDTTTLAQPIFFPVDAYFTHLNGAGTALDTIYVSDNGRNFGQGSITKWSLVAGNWVESTVSLPYSNTTEQLGFYYLSGATSGNTVTLYTNYGNGGNADFGPGFLYSMTDASGYNVNPGIPISAASWLAGTVTITANNNYAAGQFVTITGVANAAYNGRFVITSANATSFTYALASDPGASGSVTGAKALSINTVSKVAPGPVGGPWYGNETFRGVAAAAKAIATTSTLTLNGISPTTAGLSIEIGYNPTVTAQVTPAGGPVSNLSGLTVQILDTSNGNAVVGTGTLDATGKATITLTTGTGAGQLNTGSHNLVVSFAAASTFAGSQSAPQNQVIDAVFKVDTLVQTATGYVATFNALVNPANLNINAATAPSAKLVTGSTPVGGSVVFDSVPTQATFVGTGTFVTGVPLAKTLTGGASYTATVAGTGTNAFFDTLGHVLGSSTSTGGSDFINTFTSSNSTTAAIVSAPFLARGFHQAVNLPANTSSGLPISISIPAGGSAVTSASFDVFFNTADLTVTGGSITAAGFTGTVTVVTPGQVHITLSGGSLAAGTTTTVASLTASVPDTAPYKNKEILDVRNISINGGTNNGLDGSAVHVAAFVGDTDGSKSYTAQDAFNVNQVAVGTAPGFSAYQLLSPIIIGDTNTDGAVNAQDAFNANQVAVGNTSAGIPALPTFNITTATEAGTTVTITTSTAHNFTVGEQVTISGVSVSGYNGTFAITGVTATTFTYTAAAGLASGTGGTAAAASPAAGGPDPKLYFLDVSATPGSTVTVPVFLDINDPAGLTYNSDDIGIIFDPTKFSVSNVRSGNYSSTLMPASSISTASNVDNVAGTIRIGQFYNLATAPFLPNGTSGQIVLMDVTVLAGVTAGTNTPLNLAANVSATVTEVNGGAATLNPAPTNASNDAVDATFHVVAPSATLSFPNASSSGGSTITVPVNLTSGPGGFTYNSDDLGVTFDPTKLQVQSVSSGDYPGIGSTNISTAFNINNTAGTIRIGQFFNQATAPFLPAGTTGPIANITFMVLSSAPAGPTFLDLAQNVSLTFTDVNGGAIVLNPAPTNATNDPGVDGVFTVTVQPNQPPFDSVPAASAIPKTLFNPQAITGLTDPTPNVLTLSGSNAIVVSDPDAGTANVTTTVSLTGSPVLGSTGPVGILTLASTTGLTVSGNNTASVTLTGKITDINTALNGLKYTPGAGFFGTATLTVSTNDNGNSGFGGPMTDTRSTSMTVVGLFLSEIDLNSNSTLSAPSANQYLEILSSVPNYTIPSGVFVVGIEGNNSQVADAFGNSTTNNPGAVQDVFNLTGFTTGSNGYLALLEKGQAYSSAAGVVNSAGNVVTNSGTQSGFGNGGGSSVFGSLTGVHTGKDQNAVGVRLGTNPDLPGDGATAAGELSWDMEQGSASYLLIQAPSAPVVQTSTTTATDIDGNNDGVPDGTAYASWNVIDGVGVLAAPLSPTLGGTYTQLGNDFTYAPLTFKDSTNTGAVLTGSNLVTVPFTASYLGRISQFTGSSSADWLASVPTGSAGLFTLGAGTATSNTNYSGQRLNHIGGPNFWADQMKVVVNDGTNAQHAQVGELTLTFAAPVTLAGTPDRFQITSAVDNGATLNTATVTTSAAHDFQVGQTINIIGVTGTGWNGNKVITALTSTTITFARGLITANGTTGASSFAQATGSLNTSFRNIFQVLSTASISTLSEAGTTVTVTTTAPHNFSTGEQVTVSGASVSGYNGTFTITGVTANTFTYTAASSGLAPGTGGTAGVPVNLTFTIPTGGGTYISATGVANNVTVLVVRFLATDNLTVNFTNADPGGNKVGLADGNYFLKTDATKVTDSQGKQLDGDRDGNFGGNGNDEFWRLYGDFDGNRRVDGSDNRIFNSTFNTGTGNAAYLWYADFDLSGLIDTTDRTQFRNRLFTILNP